MIPLVIAVTLTVALLFGWFGAGLMFSRSGSYGVATILVGCSLLSAISTVLWVSIVILILAGLIGFVGFCAGEN